MEGYAETKNVFQDVNGDYSVGHTTQFLRLFSTIQSGLFFSDDILNKALYICILFL